MHHNLRHRKDRIRDRLVQDDHAITYLNAAAVPRVQSTRETTLHQFSVVDFNRTQIQQVRSVWITPEGIKHTEENLIKDSEPQANLPLIT